MDTADTDTVGGSGWVVLMPVYNDWVALGRLLSELDACLASLGGPVRVLVADDGSVQPCVITPPESGFKHIESITRLPLRRNLGHQRAIALGLVHIHRHMPCEAVIVMDSDGEDRPDDVPRLAARHREMAGAAVVFAERARRSERLGYRLGYRAYQALSWLMTGNPVRVGNFSVLPWGLLDQVVTAPELWNHYAAAVYSNNLPRTGVPTRRGNRYGGSSAMDYPRWVAHGIGAMSTYAPIVAARLLLFHMLFLGAALAATVALILRSAPSFSMPMAVVAAAFLAQSSLQLLALVILLLGERHKQPFLPIRDYSFFLKPPIEVYRREL